jgi:hypothetical protein
MNFFEAMNAIELSTKKLFLQSENNCVLLFDQVCLTFYFFALIVCIYFFSLCLSTHVIKKILNKSISKAKKAKALYEKTLKEKDEAAGKVAALKKDATRDEISERESALDAALLAFEDARFEYVCELNAADDMQHFDALEGLCGVVQSHAQHFRAAQQRMAELEAQMKPLLSNTHQTVVDDGLFVWPLTAMVCRQVEDRSRSRGGAAARSDQRQAASLRRHSAASRHCASRFCVQAGEQGCAARLVGAPSAAEGDDDRVLEGVEGQRRAERVGIGAAAARVAATAGIASLLLRDRQSHDALAGRRHVARRDERLARHARPPNRRSPLHQRRCVRYTFHTFARSHTIVVAQYRTT